MKTTNEKRLYPCRYRLDPRRACRYTPPQVEKYLSKISGPLLGRIDLHIEVPAVPFTQLAETPPGETDGDGSQLLIPFAYPHAVHDRRHGPAGYANYQAYKPWLRGEFTFRCIYCLSREAWYPDRQSSFSVDHTIPQVSAPDRVYDYANMVYACKACNSAKQDIIVLDPTTSPLGQHLQIGDDGSIHGLTVEGLNLIDRLGLDCESVPVPRHPTP